MAKLEIRTFPDEVLKKVAKPVTKVTPELAKLADDMLETMYDAPGVGLAAPQVGQSVRLIVIDTRYRGDDGSMDASDLTELEKKVSLPLRLFNPVIVKKEGNTSYEEGCLSVPGFVELVKRSEYVEVEALNEKGEKIKIATDGLLSICLQHEVDHLDGKLFIDRLSTVKKTLIKSKIRKHGYPTEEEAKQHIL